MVRLPDSRYRFRLALWLCVSLYSLTFLSAHTRAEETVKALRYGVTLFHYYQQDYFDALTELMTAQQLGQLTPHADNAELLRGGISLSYGMDVVAESIFQQLLDSSNEAADRNQAWFYLAKMTWQRGQLDRSAAALARISTNYQGALRDESDYLRAAVSLQQGDELHAATVMEQLPEDSPWRYYLAYNLGATEAERGDWSGAVAYFQSLDVLRGGAEESKALRDKALTAAGYARIAAGDYDGAVSEFTRVRLDSPLSDRALLGYGWASLEMEDYLAALSPWQVLGERSLLSESVRESLLAVPYAYEKLGRAPAALAGYQLAAARYEEELQRIQTATEVFRSAELPSLLGLVGEEEGQQWIFGGAILPVGDHAPYLKHLLTRHNFQLAMRELRDLYSIAWHLRDATERLAVLAHVDADQQESWAGIVNGDRQAQLQQRQQALQQRMAMLREEFNASHSAANTRAFATQAQLERWRRLDHAEKLATTLGAPEQQQARLQIMRGLLIWQDNEDFPAQSWQARKQLQELEQLAALSTQHMAGVDLAVDQRQQEIFAPRINALQARVAKKAVRVEETILRAENHIRQLAVAELQAQAQQLVAGIGQSRLAVARLYDLASPEIPR